jgi:hypothetical protein
MLSKQKHSQCNIVLAAQATQQQAHTRQAAAAEPAVLSHHCARRAAIATSPRPRRLRRHNFHAQGRASTPPPARLVISELSTAASRRPPRATHSCLPLPRLALHCILPVGSCPTASPSRHVYSPSRIPPAELPEPPLTCKHELRVFDPGRDTTFPMPKNRGWRSLPCLAPPQQPPSSSLALHRRRHCCLYFSSPLPVDLPIRAAPARGELRKSFPIHSSPSPCPWIWKWCPESPVELQRALAAAMVAPGRREFFFLFYIFFTSVLQIYMVRNFFAKLYIWHRGGRRKGPTAVPHGVRRRTVQSLFKNLYFFCLKSDGDKLYMKIVDFDEIYNFVVQSFSILSQLHSQIIDKLSISQFAVFISE